MFVKTLTVSALNNYVKKIIDGDVILNNVSLKGEISNLKIHSSGHIYFSLKDEFSKISCVMFKDRAQYINFNLQEGQKVQLSGKVKAYDKEGIYQMYCNTIKLDGVGDVYAAFLEMKDKLERKGVFKAEHKKAIPLLPKKVGIITSPTGAAIRDIINIVKRRNKNISLIIYPCLVQGKDASKTVIQGIKELNNKCDIDVIIIARGGGSIEDLWAFNDEELAMAIYDSKEPIVTGIGHEIDFTIADFVADMRAPTPSAAAEIVIPSLDELLSNIKKEEKVLKNAMDRILNESILDIKILERQLEEFNPKNIVVNQYYIIDTLKEKLNKAIEHDIFINKTNLGNLNNSLMSNNPISVLSKGYSIIEDEKNNVICSKEDLSTEKHINIILKNGKVKGNFSPVNR